MRDRMRSGSLLVVVSARAGVTDSLEWVLSQRSSSGRRHQFARALARRHPGLPALGHLRLAELEALLGRASGEDRSPETRREEILAMGERISAIWFAGLLTRSGIPSTPLDSDGAGLRVRGRGARARIDIERSRARFSGAVRRVRSAGSVPVITGYFGRTGGGSVRTLGRGSSDYVAGAVAAMVRASEAELVKGRDALRVIDPALLLGAAKVPRLSYRLAAAAGRAGWAVIDPRTVHPLRRAGIPLRITSLASERVSSLVSNSAHERDPFLVVVQSPRPARRGSSRLPASRARELTVLGPSRAAVVARLLPLAERLRLPIRYGRDSIVLRVPTRRLRPVLEALATRTDSAGAARWPRRA
ncbi:MAG: hypothetical protein L3K11_01075 [Thermoplasmata archaeon]|nr:hypothetical protein [Thermoplasmata archaeon]